MRRTAVLPEDRGPQGRFLGQPEGAVATAVHIKFWVLPVLLGPKRAALAGWKPENTRVMVSRRKDLRRYEKPLSSLSSIGGLYDMYIRSHSTCL